MLRMKFRTTMIAAAITTLCLLCLVSSSEAFQIESMYPSYGDYYDFSGYLYHTAYVKTSEPYYCIDWYINNVYVGYSSGDNVTPHAYFSPNTSDYPGSPLGKTYTIEARAWSLADADGNHDSDSDSYSVSVYSTSDVDEGVGMNTGAYGHASADAGWNGTTAEATSYGSIYNGTGKDISYRIVIFYWVIEVDNWGRQLNQFDAARPQPMKANTIRKNAPSQSASLPHSGSFEITWFEEGDEFRVETQVTVTAWDPKADIDWNNENHEFPPEVDLWRASESASWEIPDDND